MEEFSQFYSGIGNTEHWFEDESGNIQGLFEIRGRGGDLKETLNYKDGKLDGEYLLYNKNESITKRCNYKNNKLDGDYREYTASGRKVVKHAVYIEGVVVIENNIKSNIKDCFQSKRSTKAIRWNTGSCTIVNRNKDRTIKKQWKVN